MKMYCSECGTEVNVGGRFCHECGNFLQAENKNLHSKKNKLPLIKRIINGLNYDLGLEPGLFLMYLIWFFINISAFIISSKNSQSLFWPISRGSDFNDYSYEEFLIYILVPFFLLVFYSLFKQTSFGDEVIRNITNRKIIKRSRIDIFSKTDYFPIILGLYIIVSNILLLVFEFDIYKIINLQLERMHYILGYIGVIIYGSIMIGMKNRSKWYYLLVFTLPPLALILLGFKKRLFLVSSKYNKMSNEEKAREKIEIVKKDVDLTFDQKLYYIEEAIRFNPSNPMFYEDKALLLDKRGKGDDAELIESLFRKAADLRNI